MIKIVLLMYFLFLSDFKALIGCMVTSEILGSWQIEALQQIMVILEIYSTSHLNYTVLMYWNKYVQTSHLDFFVLKFFSRPNFDCPFLALYRVKQMFVLINKVRLYLKLWLISLHYIIYFVEWWNDKICCRFEAALQDFVELLETVLTILKLIHFLIEIK